LYKGSILSFMMITSVPGRAWLPTLCPKTGKTYFDNVLRKFYNWMLYKNFPKPLQTVTFT
jgi:hypothetical protein